MFLKNLCRPATQHRQKPSNLKFWPTWSIEKISVCNYNFNYVCILKDIYLTDTGIGNNGSSGNSTSSDSSGSIGGDCDGRGNTQKL